MKNFGVTYYSISLLYSVNSNFCYYVYVGAKMPVENISGRPVKSGEKCIPLRFEDPRPKTIESSNFCFVPVWVPVRAGIGVLKTGYHVVVRK